MLTVQKSARDSRIGERPRVDFCTVQSGKVYHLGILTRIPALYNATCKGKGDKHGKTLIQGGRAPVYKLRRLL